MAPAGSKSKAYSNPISTQADDAKYRTKYKELKAKVSEIEDDNTKLSVKILKSKKAIQRLRIERAILYDRLTSTTAPTNPYALSSAAHLSTLASSSSSQQPPSILSHPAYPLADPSAPSLYLKQLDAQKLAALQRGEAGFGEMVKAGVEGEGEKEREEKALLSAGGEVGGTNGLMNGAASGGASSAAVSQAVEVSQPQSNPQAHPTPVAATTEQQQMQVDQA